ncbi:MAG: hypothetical protein RDV41_01455 [Planctomycetota bacterium]|nr:hypothetical protein [Planctomycetota bacterium]
MVYSSGEGEKVVLEARYTGGMKILAWVLFLFLASSAFGLVYGAELPNKVYGWAFCVFPLGALYLALRTRQRRLVVKETGVEDIRAFSSRWFPLDDLVIITYGAPQPHVSYGATATFKDVHDRAIHVTSYEGSQSIFDALASRIIPRLAEAAILKIEQGGELRFGAIVANKKGVTAGTFQATWQELGEISIAAEGVRLFVTGRPDMTYVAPISTPNVQALIRVAQSFFDKAKDAAQGAAPQAARATERPAIKGSKRFPETLPELGNLVYMEDRNLRGVIIAGVIAVGAVAGFVAVIASGDEDVVGVLIILGIVAVISGLAAFGLTLTGIGLYQNGAFDGKKSMKWADCRTVTYSIVDRYVNGVFQGRNHNMSWGDKAGTSFSVNGAGAKMEAVCDIVLENALPPVVKHHLQIFEQDGRIDYGKLVVARDGLRYGDKVIPWDKYDSVDVRAGYVHIWEKGNDKSVVQFDLAQENGRVFYAVLMCLTEKPRE